MSFVALKKKVIYRAWIILGLKMERPETYNYYSLLRL